jgi:CSLREA domain-containing protein
MNDKHLSAAGLTLLLAAAAASANTLVVNSLDDDSTLSCATTCTLRDAIALVSGDDATITFDPALLPGTITLHEALFIPVKPITIDGPGAALLAIDGNFADRIFVIGVSNPALLPVRISALSLINGRTVAGDGTPGAAGTGDAGQTASAAGGGCIYLVRGVLTLAGVTLRNCTAQGGGGGSGGSGIPDNVKAGGGGGAGGNGGLAEGGAIYATPGAKVVLSETSIVDAHAIGGSGGKGGDGGMGTFLGPGGSGGQGGEARGGAIYLEHSISFQAINVTIAQSSAQGGKGGNGGGGDPDFANSAGGDGGDGGRGLGGLVFGQLSFPSFATSSATISSGLPAL